MAYITNYTFSKLCRNLDINKEIDLQTFTNHIYNDPNLFHFFNKLELKYLFNFKNLLENDEKYVVEYYQNVPRRVDTNSFVFEKPRKLKYHLSNCCECLKHDYVDFHIPEDIKDLGLHAIEEFRSWFKSKGYSHQYFQGNLDVSKVVFDYNMVFPSKYNLKPLNENYKLVLELANSNIHEIKSEFDYNQFVDNINALKDKRANKFQCKTTRTLSKFDYLLTRTDTEIRTRISELYSNQFVENYGLDNLKELFKYSKSLKGKLLENLTDYFKWTFENRNLAITHSSLEKFGLECCTNCKDNIL